MEYQGIRCCITYQDDNKHDTSATLHRTIQKVARLGAPVTQDQANRTKN